MVGTGGKVSAFVGVYLEIKEFEFRTLDVAADGLSTVGGMESLLVLGLPGGSSPEIGGKGKRQWMGNIPNEFVATSANNTHGIVHLDFVKGVRSIDFVPVGSLLAI